MFNEFWKSEKMRCLPNIVSLFRNEFIKFNNKGARTLDNIYHMTVKSLCLKTSECRPIYTTLLWASFPNVTVSLKID